MSYDFNEEAERKSPEEAWKCDSTAVTIESDPAVSEPMFLEWCEKNGFSFEVYGPVRHPLKPRLAGMYGCKVATWDGNFYDPKWEVFGATPSEARSRAIVAASRR